MRECTIERISKVDEKLRRFADIEGPKIAALFDNKFDFKGCIYKELATLKNCVFLVASHGEEVQGVWIGFLFRSPLDTNVRILQQQLFYVKPESTGAAYQLFQKFIDIGRREANHIITMLTSRSNIKPQTLKRWGFSELETLYRMEVSK